MSNLKLVSSFLKIRFHNIGALLLKTATTYAVGGFAAIQLSSIVVDNVSTEEVLGLTPESFMQLLFIAVLIGFPVVLISTFIYKRNSLNAPIEESYNELIKGISSQKTKNWSNAI